ncbi:MAG: PH domain-containing protein [Pyrinomonadaceae bacterium]
MFCTKCGSENKDTAVFCRKCGEATGYEAETRVAARTVAVEPMADEEKIFSIGPTLMFVKAGYVATAIGALLLVALASAFAASIVSPWIGVLIGLALFTIPAIYHLKHKLVKYTLTESTLEIDTGLISRNTRNVPIRRIQDVTVSTGVFQRLLGFGDIEIENANEEGGKVILKSINNPRKYADALLRQIRRLDN